MRQRTKRSKSAISNSSLRHPRSNVAGGGVAAIVVIIIGAVLMLIIINYAFPSTFSILTQEKEGLAVYNITPIQGEILMTTSNSIGASYSDDLGTINSVTLFIDGANVTGFATIKSTEIQYNTNLGAGSHSVTLKIGDSAGNSLTKAWSFSVNLDAQGAIAQALNEINTAREALGIYNVSLVQPVASTFRGEDMLTNQYFGHYDLNGLQPEYYYTKLGGLYTMEENIAYRYSPSGSETDLVKVVVDSVHGMIYNDAFSYWDHRNSLMDPTNNCVDIAVVNDSNRVFVVIHMIKEWVNWQSVPSFENGTFSCAGVLEMSGSTFESAIIYFSNPSAHNSYHLDTQLNLKVGESSYSIGDAVAGVQPDPQLTYQNIATLRPQTWTSNGQYFALSFPLDAINGSGLYTITLWVNNTLPMNNPYDPLRYKDSFPALEYTIKLP